MSIKDLLAVLDMSEKEQRDWLWKRKLIHEDESLADLAFRLRDEVRAGHRPEWLKACKSIYLNRCPQIQYCSLLEGERFVLEQSPIHWIIAALIAKKLKEKEKWTR